jgi:hypothetical protein
LGSLPLSTLQANIEYGFAEAKTTYGVIGVQGVDLQGHVHDRADEEESNAAGGRAGARGRGSEFEFDRRWCVQLSFGSGGQVVGDSGRVSECTDRVRSVTMALMPKRVKFRKEMRRVRDRKATKGNYVAYGDYGLQALEGTGSRAR